MTNAAYLPWRDRHSTIEAIAAWSRRQAILTGSGDAERITIAATSASLFPLLHASPLVGSLFTTDDEAAPQPTSKVILSNGMWQRNFGGNPTVLGQNIQIDGKVHTIVGVMPRDFAFPDRETQAWTPFYIPPLVGPDGKGRSMSMFNAMARLRPGVTPAQAAAEATSFARSGPDPGLVAMAVFGSNGPAEISAVPALEAAAGDVRAALVTMVVAVAFLLITATANVASLQLARASRRRREIAIRSAIGAGTRRIAGQLLVESMLLGIGGGGAGLLLASALHRALPLFLPADFPRLDDVALDWNVIGFVLALTISTGVLLGVMPALHLHRLKIAEALIDSGTTSTAGKNTVVPHARLLIMAGQVAIACTLLIGAGLLIRSLWAMMHADRGYDAANVLTARVSIPEFVFSPERRVEVLNSLLDRANRLPGITRIGFTTGLPLSGSETLSGFTMKSLRPPAGTEIQVHSVRSVVTERYFNALGMRVLEGRPFNSSDTATSPKVVLVSRAFARQYLSDTPIGDRISNFARGDGIPYEVIGIVDDVIRRGLSEPVQPEIYSLDRQMTTSTFNPNGGSLVLRTSGDPRALVDPLKSIVRELDPSMTLYSIMTMEDRLSTSLSRPRLYAVLLGTFALSALVIASVGLFGVLSYSVAQRTREIAIRTALGAAPRDIFRLVLKQGLTVTLVGLGAGFSTALALIRYLSTLLYGVTSHDWLTFTVVFVTIPLVALIACLLPALRAARIDPLTAMRAM
jgi:putative ABC transport system permease protein